MGMPNKYNFMLCCFYPTLIINPSLQTYIHLQVMYWVLEGITGFMMGIVAFLINICVSYLFQLKFNQFDKGTVNSRSMN